MHQTDSSEKSSALSPVALFELLLSSSQSGPSSDSVSTSGLDSSLPRNRTTSFAESSFDGRSSLYNDSQLDHDQNRHSLDDSKAIDEHSSSQRLLDQYAEAIACAKELVRTVGGEEDERLSSEAAVAALLAAHTRANVQALVERQFHGITSGNGSPTLKSVTEIELDKGQLSFYSARFLVQLKLLKSPSVLGHSLLDACRKAKAAFEEEEVTQPDSEVLVRSVERGGRIRGSFFTDSSSIATSPELEYALRKRKHYVLLVELLIRAHECFTAQCDVHGIAGVLRRARLFITNELAVERYYHLVLRLLTGIGRYSEMTYAFDLFREADRFELVLSKRVQRVSFK